MDEELSGYCIISRADKNYLCCMEIVLHKFLIYSSHQYVSLLSGKSVTMLQALLDKILVTVFLLVTVGL